MHTSSAQFSWNDRHQPSRCKLETHRQKERKKDRESERRGKKGNNQTNSLLLAIPHQLVQHPAGHTQPPKEEEKEEEEDEEEEDEEDEEEEEEEGATRGGKENPRGGRRNPSARLEPRGQREANKKSCKGQIGRLEFVLFQKIK